MGALMSTYSYPINWAHSFESSKLYDNEGMARILTIDLTAQARCYNVLDESTWSIDSFEVWEMKDSNGTDLTHLMNDKELWPMIKQEINEEIDKNEDYLLSKVEE